jgi:hypothetical protein
MADVTETVRCVQVNDKKGGKCNARLFDNYNNGKIDNVIIKCPKCGKFNVIKR